MTVFSQSNRRLLQAILQTPPLRQRANFSVSSIPLRTKVQPTHEPSSSISVTFGPETDQRLADLAESVQGSNLTKRKASKAKAKSTPQGAVASNSTSKSSQRNRKFATIPPAEPSKETVDDEPVMIELPENAAANEATVHTVDDTPKSRQKIAKKEPIAVTSKGNPSTLFLNGKKPFIKTRKNLEVWQIQKEALENKFGEQGWNPRKRLSPDAIDGLRHLHEQDPERYSTPVLAEQFKLSPEAIRRILKSKWRATPEETTDRRQRWARRHDRIWDQKAAMGLRPPRTRDKQPDGPEVFEEQLRAKQMLGQI